MFPSGCHSIGFIPFRLPGCCAIWLRPAPGARAAHPTEGLELRLHACNARQPLHPDLTALSLSLSLSLCCSPCGRHYCHRIHCVRQSLLKYLGPSLSPNPPVSDKAQQRQTAIPADDRRSHIARPTPKQETHTNNRIHT